MNKVVRTIEISPAVDAAVERLAKDMACTPSEVLTQAVEDFLASKEDLTIELERWAEFERTGESLSLDEVRARLDKKKQRTTAAT